jgi:hypothetical protein
VLRFIFGGQRPRGPQGITGEEGGAERGGGQNMAFRERKMDSESAFIPTA